MAMRESGLCGEFFVIATYMMADGRIIYWWGREVVSWGIVGGKHYEMDVLGRRDASSTSSRSLSIPPRLQRNDSL